MTMNDIGLVTRKNSDRNVIAAGNVRFGEGLVIIAGPCSVESEAQTTGRSPRPSRPPAPSMLRGGAFKPRTSPYAFQGLGLKGLKILDKAREETGLPIVSEVLDTRDVSWMSEYVDVLQIGARNMQNFSLLKEVGKSAQARAPQARHVLHLRRVAELRRVHPERGQPHVILCERGIRTFETYTRNTLDLSAVPAIKELTHLPVIVDPAHGDRAGEPDRAHEPGGRGRRGRRDDRRGPQRPRPPR